MAAGRRPNRVTIRPRTIERESATVRIYSDVNPGYGRRSTQLRRLRQGTQPAADDVTYVSARRAVRWRLVAVITRKPRA
jgi:hypothetical protein